MLHTLWFGYGWPSLQGNGPEGIIQSALFGLAGYFVGRAAKKHAGRLHAKLDHIIKHHPDIPPMPH